MRILGSGVPLAWVILTRLKSRGRSEYLVEADKSFPDDAAGELAAANDAFQQLRYRGILDYFR